ncbi:hypothetical protein AVEN_77921-1 [Araneus ventricosus]|uniref:Uncharacterized protein n=1 Tax=Araneus ventricosus TaxID=182803 RepID=A0A4Y2DT29_ARAVE|nr:hypothetical protein AVEN_77921-1 [Araneus ventricosus]
MTGLHAQEPNALPLANLRIHCASLRRKKDVTSQFSAVAYQRFFSDKDLNSKVLDTLKTPLKDFFTCKIVSGSSERDCDLDNAITGPYYSDGNVPSFCFSMYTFWSQPHKKFQKIKKSEKIIMEFYIDASFRGKDADIEKNQLPAYNSLSSSSVQIAMHSPYIAASPYVSGAGLLGGKDYRIQVKEDEKHLLPPPYQTNCTDYMPLWKARGGVGPLNQGMVIQECKLNETLRQLGCVPFHVDYPHNATICHFCENCPNVTKVGDNCTNLLQYYNQPCDFINYNMDVEEKLVNIKKKLESGFMRWKETLYFKEKGYDCSDQNIFSRRCQTINVEVVFDDFEITNITYIPKFESLELFSVIGGYMGMYLGVSIVAFYDFAELTIGLIYSFVKKRRNAKKKLKEQQRNAMWFINAATRDMTASSIRKRNRIRNIY